MAATPLQTRLDGLRAQRDQLVHEVNLLRERELARQRNCGPDDVPPGAPGAETQLQTQLHRDPESSRLSLLSVEEGAASSPALSLDELKAQVLQSISELDRMPTAPIWMTSSPGTEALRADQGADRQGEESIEPITMATLLKRVEALEGRNPKREGAQQHRAESTPPSPRKQISSRVSSPRVRTPPSAQHKAPVKDAAVSPVRSLRPPDQSLKLVAMAQSIQHLSNKADAAEAAAAERKSALEQQNRVLTEQVAALEARNKQLQEENSLLTAKHGEFAGTVAENDAAKTTIRQLREQLVAVKFNLVEATRRAELSEACLVRHGLDVS